MKYINVTLTNIKQKSEGALTNEEITRLIIISSEMLILYRKSAKTKLEAYKRTSMSSFVIGRYILFAAIWCPKNIITLRISI